MSKLSTRIKHAWNVFANKESGIASGYGFSSSRPTHKTVNYVNAASFVSSIYNRIALDVAMTSFRHVKIDPENEDQTEIKSGLNDCLSVEANIDQTHIQFIHDLVYSMFDEGVVAAVPVETTVPPTPSGSYEINTMRVGKIVNWYPRHVDVELYNDITGQNERIKIEKRKVAIIENPLHSVMNGENSTLKRLIKKLNELDNEDDSGRIDLLISMPGRISTPAQKAVAEERIRDIEAQLRGGKNGIIYVDGTEKATQLNRPINSQLPERVESLTRQLYNQLGLTQNILDGTAGESELRTYYTRTIDPLASVIVAEFIRKFLTKTARTQGHTIQYYRDMFKIVPVETIATLGDTLRRNEIATSNELRKIIGLKPSNDPRADQLSNPNIGDNKQSSGGTGSLPKGEDPPKAEPPTTE